MLEQWRSLGAFAGAFAGAYGARRATSIIDPEALVLFSLLLRDAERRLDDFLGWWASSSATLLSVQRAHNLAKWFPERVQERLGAFARLATEAGDRAVDASPGGGWRVRTDPAGGEGAERLALYEAPALVLRLRAGFGVGAKTDLLAFLLGLQGERASTKEAAEALGYTEVAVRTAAQEMTLARFVEETPERPVRYAADPEAWDGLLGFEGGDRPPEEYDAPPKMAALGGGVCLSSRRPRVGRGGKGSRLVSLRMELAGARLSECHRKALDVVRLRCPDAERTGHGVP